MNARDFFNAMFSFPSDFKENKALKALQFYEDNVDLIHRIEKAIEYPKFNWTECRQHCRIGKDVRDKLRETSYSPEKFMGYVASFFETTIPEMKAQRHNLK